MDGGRLRMGCDTLRMILSLAYSVPKGARGLKQQLAIF
jgi:hypothetical protein